MVYMNFATSFFGPSQYIVPVAVYRLLLQSSSLFASNTDEYKDFLRREGELAMCIEPQEHTEHSA